PSEGTRAAPPAAPSPDGAPARPGECGVRSPPPAPMPGWGLRTPHSGCPACAGVQLPASGGVGTAADMDRIAGDEPGEVGGEVDCRAGHVLGFAGTAHGDVADHPLGCAGRLPAPGAPP